MPSNEHTISPAVDTFEAVPACRYLQAIMRTGLRMQNWERLSCVVRRALSERKYRLSLRHNVVAADLPLALSRRLFLDSELMDSMDCERYEAWMRAFLSAEQFQIEQREAQSKFDAANAKRKTVRTEEQKLFRDVQSNNLREDGMIYRFGGMKQAKRRLASVQLELEDLDKQTAELQHLIHKLQGQARSITHGNEPDSLNNIEELVQEGHIRCTPGAHVTLSSRFSRDRRLTAVHGAVGRVVSFHSEGTRYVHFPVPDKNVPLQVGADGCFKCRYATEDQAEAERVREQLAWKKQRERQLQLLPPKPRGPPPRWEGSWQRCSVSYLRNPVTCFCNVPLTQFMEDVDLRFGTSAVNFAAAVNLASPNDIREPRPRSRVRVCSVLAQSAGTPPFSYSWTPKWPATALPLGLYLDSSSGEVSGVPQFLGEITCIVRCTDATGASDKVDLRFVSSRAAEDAAPVVFPLSAEPTPGPR